MKSNAVVLRARKLVGTRFRPQGRDPATGLDCIGLVLCAFEIPAEQVRRDYRMRGPFREDMEREMAARFRRLAAHRRQEGDILLCEAAPDQMHLAIHCGESFVHADARLRRVVETPGEPCWPVIAVFRRKCRCRARRG